jgi:hypothetical protein
MIAPATNRRRRSSVDATARDSTDPAGMTPDDRLIEVAAILATGVLRLRRRAISAPVSLPQSSSESSRNGLDDCAGKRLSEHRG